jgi:hypothetical protein
VRVSVCLSVILFMCTSAYLYYGETLQVCVCCNCVFVLEGVLLWVGSAHGSLDLKQEIQIQIQMGGVGVKGEVCVCVGVEEGVW